VSLAGLALELERSSPDALLHKIVQRTVCSRSGAQKTAPQLPKLLHELLHNRSPECPETMTCAFVSLVNNEKRQWDGRKHRCARSARGQLNC
jgi:hypothetical protein